MRLGSEASRSPATVERDGILTRTGKVPCLRSNSMLDL